jgi:hypothetical protein
MNYKAIIFFVVVGVYVVTATVALGSLLGIVHTDINADYKLVSAILFESAICVFALFKGARFFEPEDSMKNLKYESERLLSSLWRHDQKGDLVVSVSPTATNFRTYLRGVAQLHTLELLAVAIVKGNWSVYLTPEGKNYCRNNHKRLSEITDYYFTEALPMSDKID